MTLSKRQQELLHDMCMCPDGKGVPITRENRLIAAALVRKGLAWRAGVGWASVVIATDAGRARCADQTTHPDPSSAARG